MTWISDHKNQQKKVWRKWHYSFLLSCSLENDHFWPFFTIQSQVRESETKPMLFILEVSNLMQKKYFYNPFYPWNYQIESVFHKICSKFLAVFKVLRLMSFDGPNQIFSHFSPPHVLWWTLDRIVDPSKDMKYFLSRGEKFENPLGPL